VQARNELRQAALAPESAAKKEEETEKNAKDSNISIIKSGELIITSELR
jgi:hypothetical protein